MKPKFSTLIVLTVVCAILLTPFVFSPNYIPVLRLNDFDLYLTFQSDLYKQITGYLSLIFVFLEMMLTFRKRGRSWKIKIKVPGSIQFWRSLHIFLGIALVGSTLIHTIGVRGFNFNAIFLWVFFLVTLSALVGVVAETGILESTQRYFRFSLSAPSGNPGISKGVLIRNLRGIWLNTHIILVSMFLAMLVFHIIIAYYYQ
ncbi:hypothetical protein [Roseofilum capinflatum]|uniref:Cytochrome b561 bacterial/Ni-hydrogenase domain-containing protein n=1 Tax=Roseofilum capinflatum BLCC-M114 TaxID=3022440 RepID=A0ABT7BDU5_9CYAN|nr:hypothetical protein [Roseofilum capinflatum]MDJ1176453.1 hypothetical protein [Roseofilum capinflatum BLCC-M114]